MKHGAAILACALLLASPSLAETRRLAIVVGNNAGSGDLPPLRFAENDAGKMARVLVELGEVDANDVLLLQGRRVVELERAITDAKERVSVFRRSPDMRVVLLFYFSGHSDGEAIEMGREKLPYPRLKALLAGTGADVRVAIVDACRSGAGLREKGGKATDGFTIKLSDTLNATGEAFITSSAADEAALESSEVMGSYFTHNLISGLRGAADTSGDKLVTLGEAYRFAYDRTVSATASLPVGAQHPNYDFKLSGQGELVLASLLKPSSVLVLPEADRVLVSDLARDQVVVELPGGPVREVALAPGQYGLRVFKGGQSYGGRVSLTDGMRRVVKSEELLVVSSSVMVAKKGGEVRQALEAPEAESPVAVDLGVGLTGRVLSDPARAPGPKYQLRLGLEPWQSRFGAFNLFGQQRLGAVRVLGELTVLAVGELSFDPKPLGAEAVNEGGAQLRLGYRVALDWKRLTLALGVEAGPAFLAQLYGTGAVAGAFVGGPRLTVRLRLFDFLALTLDGDVTFTGVQMRDETGEALRWFAWPSAVAGLSVVF